MVENKLVAQTQMELDQIVQKQVNQLLNEENGLKLPTNYAVGNALKSAFFALKNNNSGDLLQTAAAIPEIKTSIANALMDMVVQGLTPAKTQVYFIKYGNKVELQRSYFGTQAALKRLSSVKDCWANVVKGNDKFAISAENDRMVVENWEPDLDSLDSEIKYVFAVILMSDGTKQYTIMTKKQIDNSWSQSKTKGSVQKKFSDEMAKRTVLNRAAKNILNTSDDSDLVVGAINGTTSNEYEENDRKDVTEEHHATVADLIAPKDGEKTLSNNDTTKDSIVVSETLADSNDEEKQPELPQVSDSDDVIGIPEEDLTENIGNSIDKEVEIDENSNQGELFNNLGDLA